MKYADDSIFWCADDKVFSTNKTVHLWIKAYIGECRTRRSSTVKRNFAATRARDLGSGLQKERGYLHNARVSHPDARPSLVLVQLQPSTAIFTVYSSISKHFRVHWIWATWSFTLQHGITLKLIAHKLHSHTLQSFIHMRLHLTKLVRQLTSLELSVKILNCY
jgi:hypothetical protein